MKPEHRKNLETLRDYLRSGELQARFNMEMYCDHRKRQSCGTVGCAVGHATLCIDRKYVHEEWPAYGARLFGVTPEEEPAGYWMFGSYWCDIDNTPEGAAARIDWYLKNGVPKDWQDQMNGNAPLCYRQGT